MEHGAGDGDPLLLAGGQGLAAAVAEGMEVEGVEGPRDRGLEALPLEPVQAPEVAQGLPAGEAGVEARAPREEAQPAADLQGVLGHVHAVDQRPPRRGGEDRGEHTQGRGLARAVGPE